MKVEEIGKRLFACFSIRRQEAGSEWRKLTEGIERWRTGFISFQGMLSPWRD